MRHSRDLEERINQAVVDDEFNEYYDEGMFEYFSFQMLPETIIQWN